MSSIDDTTIRLAKPLNKTPEEVKQQREQHCKSIDDAAEAYKDQIPTIEAVYELLDKPVLLALPTGTKRPVGNEWQKLTYDDTLDEYYQAELRDTYNTGVLLGPASGDLGSVDCDSDEYLIDFIKLNEDITTFTSIGARGGQLFFYFEGEYLRKIKALKHVDGTRVGEWRGGGGAQSVIRGIHPDTVKPYEWLNPVKPIRIRFEDIRWPEYWVLPWQQPKRSAPKSKNKQTPKQEEAVQDPRTPIQLPGQGRLKSAFCRSLGKLLVPHDFYARAGQIVTPKLDRVTKSYELAPVTANEFITSIERVVLPFDTDSNGNKVPKSIDIKLASTAIVSQDLHEQLNAVAAVNTVRLPIRRADGSIEMLPEGYDAESQVLTITKGVDWRADPTMTLEEAVQYWRDLLSEFCFHPEDRERAMSIVVAGALTLFCRHLFAPEVMRPGFLFTANSEGSGKTLLAKIIQVATLGLTAVRTAPSTDDEMSKLILAKIIHGGSSLFLDNLKGQLSTPALEAMLTSPYFEGRILGQSKEAKSLHRLTVFVTGNGLQISSDLRRRFLHVDLFLPEIRAEDRKINRNLEDSILTAERPKMLQSLYVMTMAWHDAGQPVAATVNQSFVPYSQVIGGILENAGFASPFASNTFGESGDLTTRDMQKLVKTMTVGRQYKYEEVIDLCQEHGFFSWVVHEEGKLEQGASVEFSKLLRRYVDRTFATRSFHKNGQSRRTTRFYVQEVI
jgi:hypothetical protein